MTARGRRVGARPAVHRWSAWFVVVTVLSIVVGAVDVLPAYARTNPSAVQCRAEKQVLKTAEEAYYALNAVYGRESQLVGGFIRRASKLYDVKVLAGGADFVLTPTRRGGCR